MSQAKHRASAESSLGLSYYLYLAVLLWAPLPVGSYAVMYELALACLILLSGLVYFAEAAYRRIDAFEGLRAYSLPLVLLAVVATWASIQAYSFDLDVLETLAPLNAAFYRQVAVEQGALSVSASNSAISALSTWSLLLFFVLSVQLNRSAERIRTTLIVIVLSGTAQALYGSFMTLSGLEYGFLVKKDMFLGVATGTFGGRNQLAGYLEMCLACGVGLLISSLGQQERQPWRERMRTTLDALLGPKIRLRIYLALMVVALVLTRSRMGNTAFFVALPVCGFLYMVLQQKISRGAIILFASLMLVDFLIVGQWFGFDELAERIESTSLEQDDRDEQLQDAVAMFRESPIVGYGLGAYFAVFSLFQERSTTYYDHPHNDYLEFAGELGVIGMVPLALLVLASLWMAVSAMKVRRRRIAKGAGFAASMGILSLLIHSFVDFNLQVPANAQLFVFLLALGWMARRHDWNGAG